MTIGNPFFKWVSQYLRPFLRDRLKPLIDTYAPNKIATLEGPSPVSVASGVPATRTLQPLVNDLRANVATKSKVKSTVHRMRAGESSACGSMSANSLLIEQQQAALLTSALVAAQRKKATSTCTSQPGLSEKTLPSCLQHHQQQQLQLQQNQREHPHLPEKEVEKAALASTTEEASAPPSSTGEPRVTLSSQQQLEDVQRGEQRKLNPVDRGGARTKVEVNAPSSSGAASSPRFKRCYYVPVINPLPDLKEKQLAVLDMRLYGVRDMPTFRELAPSLPPSVLSTAKLRGLTLTQAPEMVAGMAEQETSAFLSVADVFPMQEREETGVGEAEKEEEGGEEGERAQKEDRWDGKSPC